MSIKGLFKLVFIFLFLFFSILGFVDSNFVLLLVGLLWLLVLIGFDIKFSG